MFEEINNAKLLIQYVHKKLQFPAETSELNNIALLVVNHLFKIDRTDIILEKDIVLSSSQLEKLDAILQRLNKQEPVQYILGSTEFYGLQFKVNPDVLIPRQETEELVDLIIKENQEVGLQVLDIGTGTGCIAISLKMHLKDADVTAIDVSAEALQIAEENAKASSAEINFMNVDILKESPPLNFLDVIVSNPPYVLEHEKAVMQRNVLEYEPHLALFVSDKDPLLFYNKIVSIAKIQLKKGGKIYFEINESFGKEIIELLHENSFSNIELRKDMQNKDRFVKATQT